MTNDVYTALYDAAWGPKPQEVRVMERLTPILQSASLFVDVGAGIGQYVKLANDLMTKGTIIALEPDPTRYDWLCSNIRLWEQNDRGNVMLPILGAADMKTGMNYLWVGDGRISASMAHRKEMGTDDGWAHLDVRTWSLDDLIEREPDVVKIDTEGQEPSILMGALRHLEKNEKTHWLVEVHEAKDTRGNGMGRVQDLMSSMGLKKEDLGDNRHLYYRRPKEAA